MIEQDDFSTVFDRCVSDLSAANTTTTTTTMEVIEASTSLLPSRTLTPSMETSLQRIETPPVIVIPSSLNGTGSHSSSPLENLNGTYHVSSSFAPAPTVPSEVAP